MTDGNGARADAAYDELAEIREILEDLQVMFEEFRDETEETLSSIEEMAGLASARLKACSRAMRRQGLAPCGHRKEAHRDADYAKEG